jgi:hypothetical protein
MKGTRIRHQVIFCLKSGTESPETRRFLEDGRRILTAIPGVENFAVYRQVSAKNDYDFGFSMEFADRAAYDRYSAHPAHAAFVAERWLTEVSRFLEIDFEE